MATTRYVIAATPDAAEKVVSNLAAARKEADARAKYSRVDVTVTTQATGRLSYTAQGAPIAAPAPAADEAPEPIVVADMVQVEAALAAELDADPELAAMVAADDDTPAPADEDGDEPDDASRAAFDAALADLLNDATPAALADALTELDGDDQDPAPADDEPATPAADQEKEERRAECGCLVSAILANGVHSQGCAKAKAAKAKAKSVAKDPQPKRPSAGRTGGGRRETLGASAVDGWELLYDKPKQRAQVGKSAAGKYALICTDHKHAHPLARLVQERGLRGGRRSVWCPECTD